MFYSEMPEIDYCTDNCSDTCFTNTCKLLTLTFVLTKVYVHTDNEQTH